MNPQEWQDSTTWVQAAPEPVQALPQYAPLASAIATAHPLMPELVMPPLHVYDGARGSNSIALYGDWQPWKTHGGEFRRMTSVQVTKAGAYTLTLPEPLQQVALVTGGVFDLANITLDGQLPTVSTVLDVSTSYGRGKVAFPQVSPGRNAVLLFPNAGTVLAFNVTGLHSGASPVTACAIGLTLLADDNQRMTLEYDPLVCFRSEAFDDVSWLKEQLYGVDINKQLEVVTINGDRWMRARMQHSTNGIFDAKVPFPKDIFEAKDVILEVDYRHESDCAQAMTDAIKILGFRSASGPDETHWAHLGFPPGTFGTLLEGNGGNAVHGLLGYSARQHMYIPFPAGHPLEGQSGFGAYVYQVLQKTTTGDVCHYDQAGCGQIEPNTTCRLLTRIVVNDPGVANGSITFWMNGRLCAVYTGFMFRTSDVSPGLKALGVETKLLLRCIWLLGYHGGRGLPATDGHIMLRNMKIRVME